jgi:hypothetical protein
MQLEAETCGVTSQFKEALDDLLDLAAVGCNSHRILAAITLRLETQLLANLFPEERMVRVVDVFACEDDGLHWLSPFLIVSI